MNFAELREWILFGTSILVSAFTAGMIWSRLNSKIDQNAEDLKEKASIEQLNGMGARVDSIRGDCASYGGTMDEFRRELTMYRQEAREATSTLARVEQSNLEIAAKITELNKNIVAMDKGNSNRLTRLETVSAIEKKIGPLPTE